MNHKSVETITFGERGDYLHFDKEIGWVVKICENPDKYVSLFIEDIDGLIRALQALKENVK